MKQPIVIVIGTRAEAIKLIPLYLAFQKKNIPTILCATDQHLDMLNQACDTFGVRPDIRFNIMKKNQDLFHITQAVLEKAKNLYLQANPSLVIVQGDTTTTMAAALAAFYLHIPIGHVEAGLRTGNMQSPFPEEMNRKVVGQIANFHFAPTAFSTANLLAEGIDRKNVFCTGNTIVDALQMIQAKIARKQLVINPDLRAQINLCRAENKKIVLLTAHRRESFNGGLTRVFAAMKQFAHNHPDVTIFFPAHPNPNVTQAIEESQLKTEKNILIFKPLTHTDLIYLLTQVDWVASDSGGLQEEAVSLGKKILVLRDITERWEGVWEGAEVLVGTDRSLILHHMKKLYNEQNGKHNNKHGADTIEASTVYGDGKACARIVSIIEERLAAGKTVQKQKEPYEKSFVSRPGVHRAANGTHRSK